MDPETMCIVKGDAHVKEPSENNNSPECFTALITSRQSFLVKKLW